MEEIIEAMKHVSHEQFAEVHGGARRTRCGARCCSPARLWTSTWPCRGGFQKKKKGEGTVEETKVQFHGGYPSGHASVSDEDQRKHATTAQQEATTTSKAGRKNRKEGVKEKWSEEGRMRRLTRKEESRSGEGQQKENMKKKAACIARRSRSSSRGISVGYVSERQGKWTSEQR